MTRFSKLHPYPAMIADELADELSKKYVKRDARVLDPFCGTGRTLLAAAEQGAYSVGVDVNPLAILLTKAKATNVRPARLDRLLNELPARRRQGGHLPYNDLEPGRSVEWFSPLCRRELNEIIHWLNGQPLSANEHNLLAAVLSATVRETSYCRQDQWKLHRISAEERESFDKSPWSVFERRFRSTLRELKTVPFLKGKCKALLGDARDLGSVLHRYKELHLFDLVITSPPYGDSHTTVGYGGMSGICLGVLGHLDSVSFNYVSSGSLDRICLGGGSSELSCANDFKQYWYGGMKNQARGRVSRFLSDMWDCCAQISQVTRFGGRAIFIVARRTVSGYRVYMDAFVRDAMAQFGFTLEDYYSRQISKKTTPYLVNRMGSSRTHTTADHVLTMREEFVLVLRKTKRSSW